MTDTEVTDTQVSVDTQAHRIAMRGRDSLLERLRSAYGDAAAAHADLISPDDARIEALAQSAADRADGLQWRRALADVAADELGISTTEALSHPAVARAQTLVGAPSYEQSLAELIANPVPTPVSPSMASPGPATALEHQGAVEIAKTWPAGERPPWADARRGGDDELETVEADDVALELLPEPDPIEYETQAYDVEANFTDTQPPPPAPEPVAAQAAEQPAEDEPDGAGGEQVADAEQPAAEAEGVADPEPPVAEVLVPAIHLGGVANLPTKREGLSLRLSADGLDILQSEDEIVGRLIWDEIEALEVPNLRMRRRHKQLRARLVVRTRHGDASFEVPGVAGDELRERVQPLMALYGGS